MKNRFKFLSSILFALATCAPCSAQNYVVDNIYGDSVRVYQIVTGEDKTSENLGATAFYLQSGDTVTVTRILKGSTYPAITVKGKSGEYSINYGNLRFCDNNPKEAIDIWADAAWNQHRGIKKFFASFTPYAIISLLFVVAMVFLFLGLKVAPLRKLALYVAPTCLLLASVLEIWAYQVLSTDAFWWCDSDRYGFFGSLFRVIPFIAFVAFQLYSIKPYMRLLANDEDNELSIKPMLISIGICVPVALVVTFACVELFEIRGTALAIITIITFLLTLCLGIFISTKKNIKELGKTTGTMFSLFGIVWCIGVVVAVIGLIVVVFKLLIQLIAIALAFFLMAMTSKRRYRDAWGNVYEEDGFGNRTKIN